jgi:hypothetical protein
MGYMSVIGTCYGCGRLFRFHAELVPSIPIDGVKQPICADCVERANPKRVANGLPPIEVLPGAYEPQEVGP